MPHDATCPSASSPTEWCISTYAVPGAIGPAHVPMIPFTDCTPMTTGSSNHRASRSAALIVNRRVIVATVFSSSSLRSVHASRPMSTMSRSFVPRDVRRRAVQQRVHQVRDAADPLVERPDRLGVLLRVRAVRVVRALVVALDERAPVGVRRVPEPERVHLVAVVLQSQVVDDVRRHQADRVAERHHLELGRLGPRAVGRRRAAGLVPLLEHDDLLAVLRQVRGGHQAVVPAADHDRVVRVRRHPNVFLPNQTELLPRAGVAR